MTTFYQNVLTVKRLLNKIKNKFKICRCETADVIIIACFPAFCKGEKRFLQEKVQFFAGKAENRDFAQI